MGFLDRLRKKRPTPQQDAVAVDRIADDWLATLESPEAAAVLARREAAGRLTEADARHCFTWYCQGLRLRMVEVTASDGPLLAAPDTESRARVAAEIGTASERLAAFRRWMAAQGYPGEWHTDDAPGA